MISASFNIGSVTIHVYGIIIAAAIYVGWLLAKKRSVFYEIPLRLFDDPILLIPLILSIAGARIYHVIDYWSYYSNNFTQIIAVNRGGLGIFGGLFGVIFGLFIIAKIRKISFLAIADLASPSLLLGQAIGRIGNFINQEGFGPPTNLPWGVYIEPQNRPLEFFNSAHFHPTFFYEASINFITFLILINVSKKLKAGQTFGLYLIFYAIGRFITEFWRIDTATFGTLKLAHVLSAAAFLGGVLLLIKSRKGEVSS